MEKAERKRLPRKGKSPERADLRERFRYGERLKERFRKEEEEKDPSEEAVRLGEEAGEETVEGGSSLLSRRMQKKKLHRKAVKKEKAGETKDFLTQCREGMEDAAKAVRKAADEVKKHPGVLLILCGALFFIVFLGSVFSSCSVLAGGIGSGTVGASFTAEDREIEGAESFYQSLENGLSGRMETMESDYPGFDEYRVESEEVFHNPFTLTAFLTVKYEDFAASEVTGVLEELFSAQYELTVEAETETRYRTEEQEVVTVKRDKDGNVVEEVTVETVEVPYEYRILNVSLSNRTLEAVIEEWGLSAEETDRYFLLLTTGGGRSGLFAGNPYAFSVSGLDYEIPGEALSDVRFARMVEEGRKYLGYPYVWGGDSPETSFDCSGFVSWVLNHCGNGWSFGRLTAEGLREECRIIRNANARPGDLIFFQGTYATRGASHVGIYVGDGMMLHCGNPVQFASFETDYWRGHFYCFGRLP